MRSTRFRLHVGIEGETGRGDGRGRKGWREEECWVGSDAFLLVRFPSLPFEATLHRRARQSLHISYVHSIIVLPSYSLICHYPPFCRPQPSWSHNQVLSG